MRNFIAIALFLLSAITFSSCNDQSILSGDDIQNRLRNASKKEFVYNAMNYWYYWRSDVSDLADNNFSSEGELQDYLDAYSSTSTLFDNLQVKEDKFSYFIKDYEKFQDEQNGIYAALGFNYGFIEFENSNNIVGYVQYISPDGPAANTSLERLDLFTKVDGTDLNRSNYSTAIRQTGEHTLTLATIDPNNFNITETGETVNVQSEKVTRDPIFKKSVIDTNDTKIGYMMYNAFQSNSHRDLNNAFGDFKSQNIDQLVLDLRYNGGGAILTSQLLASLVSGFDSSKEFGNFTYNKRRSQNNETVYFLDNVPLENDDGDIVRNDDDSFKNTIPINALSLNKLYVLTSTGTASASESLINSLKPYIDVVVIGRQTVGKDQGSLTLFDAPPPFLNKDEANPDHKVAIQPIVLSIKNADGQGYPNGFMPSGSKNITELTPENINKKPAIGSLQEPLLKRAIGIITGNLPAKRSITEGESGARLILDSQDLRPHGKEMYLLPSQAKNIIKQDKSTAQSAE